MIHVRTGKKQNVGDWHLLALSMTLKQERDGEGHIPQNRGHSRGEGNLKSFQQ